jgi:phenylpyruvate tautomerase PptA (4-oxalocrotonate tautomerase family)
MPLAKIEVRRSRSPSEIAAMMEAVYLAQREALKVPKNDRQIRYIEHKPEHFAVPPDVSDNYTLVEITMFPGRSIQAKRNLYREIVNRFSALGIPPNEIFIVLNEPPLENWAVRGGIPASEVDLGFNLEI